MKKTPRRSCRPDEIALKSFFLGPAAENSTWFGAEVQDILGSWFQLRRRQLGTDGRCITRADQRSTGYRERQARTERAVQDLMRRYANEIPKHSLRYLGHMSSEISIPGLLGHFIGTIHNPNLISSEVARVGAEIEEEAIGAMIRAIGYDPKRATGHFTSGGTIANFEAIERAKALADRQGLKDPVVLVPENRHYSWDKGLSIFGIEPERIWRLPLDDRACLSMTELRKRLLKAKREGRGIMLIVSVAGSTEFGGVDAVDQVQNEIERFERGTGQRIWHHVDAAYGGFFRTAVRVRSNGLSGGIQRALEAMRSATSVTIDPHKLAYIPYSCGVFLARDRKDYALASVTAPYLNYETPIDRGAYTLEGSRPAGGATAVWLTEKCFGFDEKGLGRILARTVRNRLEFETILRRIPEVEVLPSNSTNILCFFFRSKDGTLSDSSRITLEFYDRHKGTSSAEFYVSKTVLRAGTHQKMLSRLLRKLRLRKDSDELVTIRLCLMNPFLGSKETRTDHYREFAKRVRQFFAARRNAA